MSSRTSNGTPTSQWEGKCSGDRWWLEVETDCFSAEEPHVVALWLEGEDEGQKRATKGLAALSPDQARELAASLLWWADNCQENRERCGDG